MDMVIDVNAVNFVEHAELLDVVLTKMQPGHILSYKHSREIARSLSSRTSPNILSYQVN